jgi:hypothetical protein
MQDLSIHFVIFTQNKLELILGGVISDKQEPKMFDGELIIFVHHQLSLLA